MTTLIAKDTSGVLTAQAGESEQGDARNRNSKTFALGGGQFRWGGSLSPIHYQTDPFLAGPWHEIDLDIAMTPGETWDAEVNGNGWQLRLWQAREGQDYVAQFRRAGRWFGMAPLGLWYVNGAGERQLVGRTISGITPTINNDDNYVLWANAFGPGLSFGYSLKRITSLVKFARIRAKADLPAPTIALAGLRLVIVMAVAWDTYAEPTGFAEGLNVSSLSLTEDEWAAPNEEASGFESLPFTEPRGWLWKLGRPKGWDSHTTDDDEGNTHQTPRFINLDWRLQRRGDRVLLLVGAPATALNAATYPVFIDVTVDEQVGADGMDGFADTEASAWYTGGAQDIVFGDFDAGGGTNRLDAWHKFTTVAVPSGATVSSAYLSHCSLGNYASTAIVSHLQAEDADDATTVTDWASYNGLVITTASVSLTAVGWTTNNWFNSDDITTIIQEVIDRGGWSTGNAIALMVDTEVTAGNHKHISYSHETDPTKAAKMQIVYTPAAGGADDNAIMWGATF